jgi:hypothetical protein
MDCKQQKFVDFEVLSRSFGRQKKFGGHFEGASKTMESCILRRFVDRWHGRDEITRFVHDQDTTASAILVERDWKRDEYFDKNHVVKSWERIFQQNQWVSVSVDKGKTRRKNVLLGLKLPLLRWFYNILNMDVSVEAKRMLGLILTGISRNHNTLPRRDNSYGRIVTRKNAAGV